MTLNELMPKLCGSIHIGTKNGTGFIYAGKANAFKPTERDNKVLRCLIRDTQSIKRTDREVQEILKNYIPLGLRKVVDMYPSISKQNTTIVIIEGNERESQMNDTSIAPPTTEFHGCIDSLAVERLVAGIYKQVAEELEDTYDKTYCLVPWLDVMASVDALEQSIKLSRCKGAMLRDINRIRIVLADIKRWIDDGTNEQRRLQHWLMRETDPDINGHISNPSAFIRKVKTDKEISKRQRHYESFARCFTSEDET